MSATFLLLWKEPFEEGPRIRFWRQGAIHWNPWVGKIGALIHSIVVSHAILRISVEKCIVKFKDVVGDHTILIYFAQ